MTTCLPYGDKNQVPITQKLAGEDMLARLGLGQGYG